MRRSSLVHLVLVMILCLTGLACAKPPKEPEKLSFGFEKYFSLSRK